MAAPTLPDRYLDRTSKTQDFYCSTLCRALLRLHRPTPTPSERCHPTLSHVYWTSATSLSSSQHVLHPAALEARSLRLCLTPSPPPPPLTHEEISAAYEVSQFTAPRPDPTALLAPIAKAKITRPLDRPHLVANGTFDDELRTAWTKAQGPFNAPLAHQQFTTRIGFYGWDEAYFNLRNNAAQLELAHRTNPDDLLFATPNAHQGPPYSSAAVTVRKFENEPICLFWYPTYEYGVLNKIFRWTMHIGPVVPIDQLNPIIPPNSSHWLLEYGAALLGDTFTPVTVTTVFIPACASGSGAAASISPCSTKRSHLRRLRLPRSNAGRPASNKSTSPKTALSGSAWRRGSFGSRCS
ncbi:hypothetical protein GGX14DRAFT_392011 [Mycena pura]|uniref:Uncharacterized protein n=1 Tax=Mycena pura TaxID=153505 RepID=A0AAD6YDP0_9AGAR|nr:hypothetical protein GGX14DRAFT_392011 [Mycena pura]